MIGKITNGSRPGDIAAYLHGPGRHNEHIYNGRAGGAVIAGTVMVHGTRSGVTWAQEMREAAATRKTISKPIWHMSLRAAPDDRVLSDDEWADIGQSVAEDMGWDEQPWVMVRHGEDHVHLVVSRVNHDGQVWRTNHDRVKARAACRKVEAEYGLRETAQRTTVTSHRTHDHQISRGERERAEATGQTPPRVLVAERVRYAAHRAKDCGRGGFEVALDHAGVLWRANVASTGRVSGYSFALPGDTDAQGEQIWFKASQLDKSLSWPKLRKVLGDHDREPRPAHPEMMPTADRWHQQWWTTAPEDRARVPATRPKPPRKPKPKTLPPMVPPTPAQTTAHAEITDEERAKLEELKRAQQAAFPPIPRTSTPRPGSSKPRPYQPPAPGRDRGPGRGR